jgi:hypothetical protein
MCAMTHPLSRQVWRYPGTYVEARLGCVDLRFRCVEIIETIAGDNTHLWVVKLRPDPPTGSEDYAARDGGIEVLFYSSGLARSFIVGHHYDVTLKPVKEHDPERF